MLDYVQFLEKRIVELQQEIQRSNLSNTRVLENALEYNMQELEDIKDSNPELFV